MSVAHTRDLYFITDADERFVKIGLSRDVHQRLESLQAGSPLVLVLKLVIYDCGRPEEERLHHAFAQYWRHREWFDYADAIKVRVDAALEVGEWDWTDIPATRDRYDPSFGGLITHYELLAHIKAEASA